jgi:exosome complex RNA-binding protein Rrp4
MNNNNNNLDDGSEPHPDPVPKPKREVVVPGDLLDAGELRAGIGTYQDGDNIFASQLGFKDVRSNFRLSVKLLM